MIKLISYLFLLTFFLQTFCKIKVLPTPINGTCDQKNYQNDLKKIEKVINRVKVGGLIAILEIILSLFNMFIQIKLIKTFIYNEKVRKYCAIQFLAFSINFTLKSMLSLINGIFFFINSEFFNDGSDFCSVTGFIYTFYDVLDTMLNVSLTLYFINEIKNRKHKKYKKFHWIYYAIYNFILVAMSIFCTSMLYKQNMIGKNQNGFCQFKSITQTFQIYSMIIISIYLIISIPNLIYFKKYQKKSQKVKRIVIEYTKNIILTISIFWTLQTIIGGIQGYSCYYKKFTNQDVDQLLMLYINIQELLYPIILTHIFKQNPFINIKKNQKKNKNIGLKIFDEENNQNHGLQISNKSLKGIQQSININQSIIVREQESHQQNIVLSTIQKYFRIKKIMSEVISSSQIFNNDSCLSQILSEQELDKYNISKIDDNLKFSFYYHYNIDTINKLLQSQDNSVKINASVLLESKFYQLINKEQMFFDFENSLDLKQNNKNSIQKIQDGGNGGDWIFFSHDNQLIIKSISNDSDLNTLLSISEKYLQYLSDNKQSLISKIYGIFQIEHEEITNNYILMRNINLVPSKFIHRIYDLKGSDVQRQTEFDYDSIVPTQKIEKTLKDVDFNQLEQRIYIHDHLKKSIFEIIKNDSLFFRSLNIMDYSLLVSKVNHKQAKQYFLKKHKYQQLYILENIEKYTNKYPNFIQSNQENGYYYHIVIIDYLQIYNNFKKLESTFKHIKNKLKSDNCNNNISAVNSEKYQNRFQDYIQQILNINNFNNK